MRSDRITLIDFDFKIVFLIPNGRCCAARIAVGSNTLDRRSAERRLSSVFEVRNSDR